MVRSIMVGIIVSKTRLFNALIILGLLGLLALKTIDASGHDELEEDIAKSSTTAKGVR